MWSGDSTTTPDELAEAARCGGPRRRLHHRPFDRRGCARLARVLGCRVVVGQEQRTPSGELIGLFLSQRIPPDSDPPGTTALAIREQGGLVYVPHPFDPLRHRLEESVFEDLAEQGFVDAVEVRNGKTSLEHLNEQAARAATRLGLPGGAGSDAHVPEAIGSVYVEVDDFIDGPSFLCSLRGGQIVGHHFDGARAFRPHVRALDG